MNKSISFTLCPAYSRVGKGNLVLKHFVPHFLPNLSKHCALSGGIHAGLMSLVLEYRNENIKKLI